MKTSNKISITVLLISIFVIGGNLTGIKLSPTAHAASPVFTRNLTLGMSGADVSSLQQILIAGGFLKGSASTGYFGLLTKNALGAWQTKTGIYPPVGFFGLLSRVKINMAAEPMPLAETTTPGTNVTSTPLFATTSAIISNVRNGFPVRLKIPKLNVNAGFQYLGLKLDGTMKIPNNIVDVGWYTGSPRPGEKGNSIITGHVAQIRRSVLTKPGVFMNLNELSPGDKLSVLDDKGKTIIFVVRESRLYDPAADATDVFISKDNGAHLILITCEGTWNQEQLSYSQRLVIFTDVVQ